MSTIDIDWGVRLASIVCVGFALSGCSQGPLAIGEGAAGQGAGGASGDVQSSSGADAPAATGGRATQSTGGKAENTGGLNTGGQGTSPPDQNNGGTAGVPPEDNTGGDQVVSTAGPAGAEGYSDVCEVALPLRCGDRLAHSTTIQGQPNQWYGYNCTQRWEGGRETIYHFSSDQDCTVDVRLVDLTTDLDVFLVECDPGSCGGCASYFDEEGWVNAVECSSVPLDLQDSFVEAVSFNVVAGQGRAVVVDGYDYSEGTYTIEVDCACP
jgi:hypothetical protein